MNNSDLEALLAAAEEAEKAVNYDETEWLAKEA
jgi:hypothetical protein